MKIVRRWWFPAVVLILGLRAGAATVLVEAESFDDLGGWAVDQQFILQMGSSYLLAHGLGQPVADATTTVAFPRGGRWRVFVRTQDWVAKFGASPSPGTFKIALAGSELPVVFGTNGKTWAWQQGGTVSVPADRTRMELHLHDLTGFEGRCDAILFTDDPGFVPPEDAAALAALRRQLLGIGGPPEDAGDYDFVVVGGGIAGICSAVAAARSGCRVALIQDRPVLGGNNSSEVRVWLSGQAGLGRFPKLGGIVHELDTRQKVCPDEAAKYRDDQKLELVKAESNISLFLSHFAHAVETDGQHITAVTARHIRTGRDKRFRGRWFADCTGDGTIGSLAGADLDMTVDGHMGRTNLWAVEATGNPTAFPRCPWAVDLSNKPFPTELKRLGKWFWESGFYLDPIAHSERIRDNNLRAMYGAWSALKNDKGLYPNHRLIWAAYIAGKRESRRLLGDVVLTQEDAINGRDFPDAFVPCTWSIDLHLPDWRYNKGIAKGDEFLSKANFTQYKRPYHIPYRCLYSRNIDNLFMAGRDISVTHEALGTVRVMRTTGMMGELVGMAVGLCKQHDCSPREVYKTWLDALTAAAEKGLGKPVERVVTPLEITLKPVPKSWGADLALKARPQASGSKDAARYPVSHCIDGVVNLADNEGRWLSDARTPHWVELRWPTAARLGAVRIVSGYRSGGSVDAPITDFCLQTPDGDGWATVPGTDTRGNQTIDWRRTFEPVTTDRLRLYVTATSSDISRVHEIAVYGPPQK